MRILVSGGTGFIGSSIVQALTEICPEAEVQVLSRRAAGAAQVRGDVTQPDTLAGCVNGTETVIHSVQFPHHPVENPRKGWTYERVDGVGTKNLVAACVQARVRRFVYLSGAGVGPHRSEPWFRAKYEAETAIRQSGMDYAILRPSWIYGPGDRSLNRFVDFSRRLPFVPVIGDGKSRVQPVSVSDVSRIAASCATRTVPPNRVFELAGPQQLSMNEVLRTVQRVVGKRRPLIHFPAGMMKWVAGALSLLPQPPLSPSAIDFLTSEEIVDPRPTEEFFGMKFEDLETGLRRYL
jgi:uncharacterized protein YbjT (DUF2867 family)